jgi:hypothetical protein
LPANGHNDRTRPPVSWLILAVLYWPLKQEDLDLYMTAKEGIG